MVVIFRKFVLGQPIRCQILGVVVTERSFILMKSGYPGAYERLIAFHIAAIVVAMKEIGN